MHRFDESFGEGLDLWEVKPLVEKSRRGSMDDFHGAPAPAHYDLPSIDAIDFRGADVVSFDTEGHDPNLRKSGPGYRRGEAYMVGFSFRTPDGRGDYFPIRHDNGPNLDPDRTLAKLRHELAGFEGVITGANLLYDFDALSVEGIHAPKATVRDVQWGAPLLDENATTYGLDDLGQRYLGRGKLTDQLSLLYGTDYIKHMREIHPGHVREYALGDVDLPLDLLPELERRMRLDGDAIGDGDALLNLFHMECNLFPLLARMREYGVKVDLDRAQQVDKAIGEEHEALLNEIHRLHGIRLSDTAPSGEVAYLLEKVGVEYPTTKEGNPTIVKPWLQAHPHPVCQMVVQAREFKKIRGTFIQSYILDKHINGRLHCQFHPLRNDEYGTVSGRFSSSDPNLQNIPVRHPKLGPLLRSMFIPEDGRLWWSRDYSQIEYRFLVHYALQQRIKGADVAAAMYRDDPKTDFHSLASKISGVDRKYAKSINFGVAYGMGEETMATNLGVPILEARGILEDFHKELPFLKGIFNRAKGYADKHGYIPTILRRRRRFPTWEKKGFNGKDAQGVDYDTAVELWGKHQIRRSGTRKALNSLLQGSNADIMKQAMVKAWRAGLFDGTGLDVSLTVHDELDGDMDQTPRAVEALRELVHIMTTAIDGISVPILADGTEGANWQDAK